MHKYLYFAKIIDVEQFFDSTLVFWVPCTKRKKDKLLPLVPLAPKRMPTDKKKTAKQRGSRNDDGDMAKNMSIAMQPHNILAATIEGQHSLTRFLSPMMDTELNFGSKDKSQKKSKSSAKACKDKGRGKHRRDRDCESYSEDSCSSTESCSSSSSSSSSEDCDNAFCPNPIVDVTSMMENPAKEVTRIPFGFVPSVLDITTEEDMPFILTYVCNNQQVSVTPNTGFTLVDVQNALGLSQASFCVAGSGVILANLPATMAQFEGLYLLAALPNLDLSGYMLYRVNWRDDDCGSIEVGEWIAILLGATAGVYAIDAIVESTQQITLNPTLAPGAGPISSIQCARITHMTVPGQKYCYFDELPMESESDCSYDSSEDCSNSCSDDC